MKAAAGVLIVVAALATGAATARPKGAPAPGTIQMNDPKGGCDQEGPKGCIVLTKKLTKALTITYEAGAGVTVELCRIGNDVIEPCPTTFKTEKLPQGGHHVGIYGHTDDGTPVETVRKFRLKYRLP